MISRKDLLTMSEAALMLSDDKRNVHPITVLYGALCGILPGINHDGEIYLLRGVTEEKILSGFALPLLKDMIIMDLKRKGVWEIDWDETWEREERPMSEEQFRVYEKQRLRRLVIQKQYVEK